MSEEEKKALEEKEAEGAAAQKDTEPTELEKQLAEKDALIAKITLEKNNYRKGMLKAKGKLKDDESDSDDEEDIDAKVARLVKEQLLDTQFEIAKQEKDDLIKKTLARNKELELTLKNRSQLSTSDSGAGSEAKFTVKDNTLSAEKITKFKAMGWDDAKIERYKKNLTKIA